MFDELQRRVTQWWGTRQKATDLAKIDPTIIATIIQLIVTMVQNCIPVNASTVVHEMATKNPVRARVMIWMAARKSGLGTHKSISDIVECVAAMGEKATPDEIQGLFNETVDFGV